MTKSKKRLGTDLGALLGISNENLEDGSFVNEVDNLTELPIELLQPGKYQPRSVISDEKIAELSESIKQHGIMQPLVVRKLDLESYEIIAGERRWRACQKIGIDSVPVIVKEVTDQQAIAMSLIENIQREDLNVVEEAKALIRLQNEFQLTQQEVADMVSKPRSTVTNLMRIIGLENTVLKHLELSTIEMGHAKCLLGLSVELQRQACEKILASNLTVRQTETLVKKIQAGNDQGDIQKHAKSGDFDILRLQNELSEKLGSPIVIKHNANGSGKLIVKYFNNDQLEGIIQKMS